MYLNFGELQLRLGEYDAAEATLIRAEHALTSLPASDDSAVRTLELRTRISAIQGMVLLAKDNLNAAAEKLNLALGNSEELLQLTPSFKNRRAILSIATKYGINLQRLNRNAEAKEVFERCEPIAITVSEYIEAAAEDLERSLETNQRDKLYGCVLDFYRSYWYVSSAKRDSQFFSQLDRSLEILDRMEIEGLSTELRELRAGLYNDFAVYIKEADPTRSLSLRRKAIQEYKHLFLNNQEVPNLRISYAMSLRNLSVNLSQMREDEAAENAVLQAEQLMADLSDDVKSNAKCKRAMAMIHGARVVCFFNQGDLQGALAEAESKRVVHAELLASAPDSRECLSLMARSHLQVSKLLFANGQTIKSFMAYTHASNCFEELGSDELDSPVSLDVLQSLVNQFRARVQQVLAECIKWRGWSLPSFARVLLNG